MGICATDDIRQACPLACGSKFPCWEGGSIAAIPSYTIWQRIMHLQEHEQGAGVICAREGIDLIQRCRDHQASPVTVSASGAMGWESVGTFGPKPFMDIDINNCDTLSSVVNHHCSFATPGDWTKNINLKIKKNGETH